MAQAEEPDSVTRYQFQIEDEKWANWKDTVPRRKSLETRIIELIEADTESRVVDAKLDLAELSDTLGRALDELPADAPGRGTVEDVKAEIDRSMG